MVVGRPVTRQELGLLGPDATAAHEDVRRARIRSRCRHRRKPRPGRYPRRARRSRQSSPGPPRHSPGAWPARSRRHRCARRRTPSPSCPVVVIAVSPDQGGIPGERDGAAKVVVGRPVTRQELGLLGPDATAAHEDVRRTRVSPVVVIPASPDQGGIPGERDGDAKLVAGRPVTRQELGLLGPDATAAHEDVRRARD